MRYADLPKNGISPAPAKQRDGHVLNQYVDSMELRAELIRRLGRGVEIVSRPPKAGTPGVVIVEDANGNAIDVDSGVVADAITTVALAAPSSNSERRALTAIDEAPDMQGKLAAIRDWLAREAEVQR